MPDTYSQIYIQIVLAVKHRDALIHTGWEERLYQYITGIIQNRKHKMLAIHGMPDHIHLFIGMQPDDSISDIVREIKKASNDFINENKFTKTKFYWQEGFGAFSYSKSQIDSVVKYIMNQKDHHKKTTFKDEYIMFLRKFEIDYQEIYLFDWITN